MANSSGTDKQIQTTQYDNADIQGDRRAKDQVKANLQRRYLGNLANEDKYNGITITLNSNEEAEYPYIPIYRQNSYRRHKTRVFLACKQGRTCFQIAKIANTKIRQISLSHITSGKSTDCSWSKLTKTFQARFNKL